MNAPTLRDVIAESGGAELVKRTGKSRIEGVDYVRRGPGEAKWLTGGKSGLNRAVRKPTADELAARWAMCERQWAESCEVAGWRRQAWRVADGRFALTYQRALLAAIEARGPKSMRGKRKPAAPKPAAKPKPKRTTPKPATPVKVARVDTERDLIRLYRSELIALDTPEARAEIERRKVKRAAKRAAAASGKVVIAN